jgi:hypothetical protein
VLARHTSFPSGGEAVSCIHIIAFTRDEDSLISAEQFLKPEPTTYPITYLTTVLEPVRCPTASYLT